MKRLNILTTAALINPLELWRHVTEKGLRSIPNSKSPIPGLWMWLHGKSLFTLKLLRSADSFRRDLKTFLFHSVYTGTIIPWHGLTLWCALGLLVIIIIITTTMFMVLSSWHSHCESSPGSFDECRLSAGWPPTLRPKQPIWAVSPPKDSKDSRHNEKGNGRWS